MNLPVGAEFIDLFDLYNKNPKDYGFQFQVMVFNTLANALVEGLEKFKNHKIILLERSIDSSLQARFLKNSASYQPGVLCFRYSADICLKKAI